MSYISLIYKNIYFRADYLIHYYSMLDIFRLWIFLSVHMEYMHVHKDTHAQEHMYVGHRQTSMLASQAGNRKITVHLQVESRKEE